MENSSEQRLVFNAARLGYTRASAIDVLRHDQCIRVCSAISKSVIDETAAKAKSVFAEFGGRDQEVPKGVPFFNDFLIGNMTMLESNPANLNYPIIRAIRLSPVWNIITGYLRSRSIYCLIPISTVRMVTPERQDIAIPFHQDGFGLPDEPDCDMVSVWVLLSPESCGPPNTAPGLELLVGPVDHNLEIESNPVHPKFRSAQADNRQVAAIEALGARRWTPKIETGDVMMFTRYNLHRTLITDSHRLTRYSVETRFLAINPSTKEIFEKRKNPVIEMDDDRSVGPRTIDWITSEVSMQPLNWPLPRSYRGSRIASMIRSWVAPSR